MEDGGHVGVRGEDGGDVFVGFPCVDDGGLAGFGRQGELGLEGGAAGGTGGVIVVVVEAHLARPPRSAGPASALAQPRSASAAPVRGVVGVHAGGGDEPGSAAAMASGALGAAPAIRRSRRPAPRRPPRPARAPRRGRRRRPESARWQWVSISIGRRAAGRRAVTEAAPSRHRRLPPLTSPDGLRLPAAAPAPAPSCGPRWPRAAGPGQRCSMASSTGEAM